jgi:ParB family chromosome partitioning protein
MSPIAVKPNRENQKHKDIQEENPTFTGKSIEFTEPDLTKIIPNFDELNNAWPLELRLPLKERPRHVYAIPIKFLEQLKGLTPRRHTEEKINLLAESIKKTGMLHNIIATIPIWQEQKEGQVLSRLSIVCGVGRTLAAEKAGLKHVKVELVALNNLDEVYLLSITENLERTELSKIEEAELYVGWIGEAKVSALEISKKINRSLSYVSNMIRLRLLPVKVQNWIHEGKLPYSFGLSLLEIKSPQQQEELAELAIEDKLSRTQLEAKIKELQGQERLQEMKLDVEKPQETKQTQPSQTTSPLQRATEKRRFTKEPESKIEELTGQDTRKLGEVYWIQDKIETAGCAYKPDCSICENYKACFEMLKGAIKAYGSPPKQYWKILKWIYKRLEFTGLDYERPTFEQMAKELESLGFNSTEIRQEIQSKYAVKT